ncbi:MAG: GHMP kinase [candidate division Zixibacteria bacterium]|nr:GHMP kinase [candidate division Zixibacteria bacterium]
MIITRTPFRISFAGGGTDLEAFYSQHPGCVLSTAINKYMYISIHPYFDNNQIWLKYSKTECASSYNEIEHRCFRQVLYDFKINGVEITTTADVPAGTGLGSSSSFTVGLLLALYSHLGIFASKERIAKEACEIEINKLKEPIGKQDQYAAAYGGLSFIKFHPDGTVSVDPVIMKSDTLRKLQENLLMFYTGDVRSASAILKEQRENTKSKEKFNNLEKMTELAHSLLDSLQNNNLSLFGEILHEGWLLKKTLANGISNGEINHYYDIALKNGAKGGKLLGAGGGGFLLFYCEKEDQEKLRLALSNLKELKFKFDFEGAKVIYIGNND